MKTTRNENMNTDDFYPCDTSYLPLTRRPKRPLHQKLTIVTVSSLFALSCGAVLLRNGGDQSNVGDISPPSNDGLSNDVMSRRVSENSKLNNVGMGAGRRLDDCHSWHMSIEAGQMNTCTNSGNYPLEWNDDTVREYMFLNSPGRCCEKYFGAGKTCHIIDVCGDDTEEGAATSPPTASPTSSPTSSPTASPTASPTSTPTALPTASPTSSPTSTPTASPIQQYLGDADVPMSEPSPTNDEHGESTNCGENKWHQSMQPGASRTCTNDDFYPLDWEEDEWKDHLFFVTWEKCCEKFFGTNCTKVDICVENSSSDKCGEWHPSSKSSVNPTCTNSLDYPEVWNGRQDIFFQTAEGCCTWHFGAPCITVDVCGETEIVSFQGAVSGGDSTLIQTWSPTKSPSKNPTYSPTCMPTSSPTLDPNCHENKWHESTLPGVQNTCTNDKNYPEEWNEDGLSDHKLFPSFKTCCKALYKGEQCTRVDICTGDGSEGVAQSRGSWHPSHVDALTCTNSNDYPEVWADRDYMFFDSAESCCNDHFGGPCTIIDQCASVDIPIQGDDPVGNDPPVDSDSAYDPMVDGCGDWHPSLYASIRMCTNDKFYPPAWNNDASKFFETATDCCQEHYGGQCEILDACPWGTFPPSKAPVTRTPTLIPTFFPTHSPVLSTNQPSSSPSYSPSNQPSVYPSSVPTIEPSISLSPTYPPTMKPTSSPTPNPTRNPTRSPTNEPTGSPIDPLSAPITSALFDDFEGDEDLSVAFPWNFGDPPQWELDYTVAFSGSRSLRSTPVTGGLGAFVEVSFDISLAEPMLLRCFALVDTSMPFELTRLLVDDQVRNNYSRRTTSWEPFVTGLKEGDHTIKIRVQNANFEAPIERTENFGTGTVWIDYCDLAKTLPEVKPRENNSVGTSTEKPTDPPTSSPTNVPTKHPTKQPIDGLSDAPPDPVTNNPTQSPTPAPTEKSFDGSSFTFMESGFDDFEVDGDPAKAFPWFFGDPPQWVFDDTVAFSGGRSLRSLPLTGGVDAFSDLTMKIDLPKQVYMRCFLLLDIAMPFDMLYLIINETPRNTYTQKKTDTWTSIVTPLSEGENIVTFRLQNAGFPNPFERNSDFGTGVVWIDYCEFSNPLTAVVIADPPAITTTTTTTTSTTTTTTASTTTTSTTTTPSTANSDFFSITADHVVDDFESSVNPFSFPWIYGDPPEWVIDQKVAFSRSNSLKNKPVVGEGSYSDLTVKLNILTVSVLKCYALIDIGMPFESFFLLVNGEERNRYVSSIDDWIPVVTGLDVGENTIQFRIQNADNLPVFRPPHLGSGFVWLDHCEIYQLQ